MSLHISFQPFRLNRLAVAIAALFLLGSPELLSAQVSSAGGRAGGTPRAAEARSGKLTTPQVVERLMTGTGFVLCPQVRTGTCWVVDLKRRLVVTNQHVIDKVKTVHVYFPVKKDGEWVTDISHYLRSVKPTSGNVILSDVQSDLALVQLDRIPDGVRAFELAKRSARQGSKLHTIGGKPLGSDSMWVYTLGHVRQVGRGRTAMGLVTRIVEAQMEFNQGNSGGPIVDDFGKLVAVVEGYRVKAPSGATYANVRNVSMAIDVLQVRKFLKEGYPLVEPKTAKLFAKRGKRHSDEGRHNQAIKDFSNAIRRDKTLAVAFAGRGWAFHLKGDSRTAIGDYDEAIKIDGNLEEAHYGRGLINRNLGKTKEALADFTNAIRINAEIYRNYNERGITYFRTRQYKSAYSDFTRAAKLNPTNSQLHANRAYAAQNSGDFATAVGAFVESLRLNPRNAENLNQLGVCLYRLKNFTKATQAFEAAIKITPNNALYHVNLGDARHHLNKHESAIQSYSTAIRLRKTSSAYYSRGASFAALKKYAAAIADFTDAIRLNPKFAPAYFRRALAYQAAGSDTKSAADLQKAAQLDPKTFGKYAVVANVAPRDPKVAVNPGIVGTWVCVGKINGVSVKIQSTMTAAGRYTTTAVYQQPNTQAVTETESGTYSIKGDNMTINPDNDKPTTRKFGFKNGQLWLFLQENKLTLYFSRQK